MDYFHIVGLSDQERLQLAQDTVNEGGRNPDLLLTGVVKGYRAQRELEKEGGEPGHRWGMYVNGMDEPNELVVCIGGWEELGVFTARWRDREIARPAVHQQEISLLLLLVRWCASFFHNGSIKLSGNGDQ